MQLNSTTQHTQVDALRELTASMFQRNFIDTFASIPIFDGSKKEDCLNGYKGSRLPAYRVCVIFKVKPYAEQLMVCKTDSWVYPLTSLGQHPEKNLKRHFYDLTSIGHITGQYQNMT